MTNPITGNRWNKTPAFFLLLPVFFVLHGVRGNAGFVPIPDALLLLGIYIVSASVLYLLCYLFFRNHTKAALGSFVLMSLHFFFGWLHDQLKTWLNESFITRYSFLLPVLFVLLVILFIWLKRKKDQPAMVTGYLNALLAVLIVLELLLLGLQSTGSAETKMQASRNAASEQFSICDTCIKPDIYLIVLDEYAGHVSLKDLFGFDNILFEKQLQQRGFHVVINSTSNYNYTPFSMASMLNMEYLSLQNTDRLQPDLRLAFRMINENKVKKLLTGNGYEFINHSVFNFPKQPAPVEEGFIPFRTRLITSQTLLTRLQRDLGYHLVTTFRIRSVINQQAYRELRNNTKLYDLTMKLANQPRVNPRFVYTHLMMPHYPYYFNKDGAPMDPKRVLPEANNVNRKDYVEYLQYVNKKILHLADHILKSSETPPVILIMSDHGFRHFRDPVSPNYHFMNLNAVWLPDKEYEGFYDGFSNVNQFRTVFNALFGSGFTMLKDSAVYLRD